MRKQKRIIDQSEIVASSNAIKYSLNQLASDVLYKTRIVAEEKESILNKENLKSKENFEYEYQEEQEQ